MTYQEQALLLLSECRDLIKPTYINTNKDYEKRVKKLALFTVDKLILYLPSDQGNPPGMKTNENDREWWVKVKEKLIKI